MIGPDLETVGLTVLHTGQAPSGAFVAGPTFSQYGYAWLRDGSFIADALDEIGEIGMASRFHGWVGSLVLSSAAGVGRSIAAGLTGRRPDPADYLHCRYTLDGRPGPDDWPTFQLDGPGIWLWSLARHIAAGGLLSPDVRVAAETVGSYLAALWSVPSSDAWEEFEAEVHTSTLAADLAGLHGLVALVPRTGDDVAIRAAIDGITARLWPSDGGRANSETWTKWPGSNLVDASLLWIVGAYELADPLEPRAAATIARIEADLVDIDGGVHRYRDDTYYGGGAWPLLTAALGRVYLRRGQPGDVERARRCLVWIEAQAGPDGALPEQLATRAFHPERIAEWRAMWGESASPLLWSHATHLGLRAAIAAADARPGSERDGGATERGT